MLDWLILSPDCQAFGEQLEKKCSDSIRLGLWLGDNLEPHTVKSRTDLATKHKVLTQGSIGKQIA